MSNTVDVILKSRNDLRPGFDSGRVEVRRFVDGTIGDFRRISGSVFNLRNLIAGAAAGGALKMILSPAIEMETYSTQFEVLLGSADAARQRLEGLAEFAATTPFELPGIVRASKLLQTLTGGAFADVQALRLVGDAASASNRPIEELAVWFGRLYDGIRTKGNIGDAMMRLQELGVISSDLRGRIEKLRKENASSNEVWAEVVKGMERYQGMTERVSRTTEGRLSTMRDSFTELKRIVGEQMLPTVNTAIEETIATIERLKASGELQEFGSDAAAVLQGLYEVLRDTTAWLVRHRDGVRTAAEAYVAFRVISAATESVIALTRTLRTLEAAHYAAAAAAKADAAAHASAAATVETSVTKATIAAGLLRSWLMAIGPQLVAVGVAGIVAEVLAIKRAVDDANDALRTLGIEPGNSWIETGISVAKAWSPAYQAYAYMQRKFGGPREVLTTAAPTQAERDAARRQFEAAGGKAPGAAEPPPAPAPAGPTDDEAKVAESLRKDAEAEIKRRTDLRREISEKERALAAEAARTAAETEEWQRHERAVQMRQSTDEYILALRDYATRAEKARREIQAAETDDAKRAAAARLAQAERLARSEADALRERAQALRAESDRLAAEAAAARERAEALLPTALDPRLAREQAREQRDAARRQRRLESRIGGLRDRGMERDDQGVWRDRFGRAASGAGQAALNYDQARRDAATADRESAARRDEAGMAERHLAETQDRLQAASVDLTGEVAALRTEIAGLRNELATGGSGPMARRDEFDLVRIEVGAQALLDAANQAAAAIEGALVAKWTGADEAGSAVAGSAPGGAPPETAASGQPAAPGAAPATVLPPPPSPAGGLDLDGIRSELQRHTALLERIASPEWGGPA